MGFKNAFSTDCKSDFKVVFIDRIRAMVKHLERSLFFQIQAWENKASDDSYREKKSVKYYYITKYFCCM